jgi:hypothetical protein
MTAKNISFVLLAIVGMVGYNIFLSHRDHKLFESYYGTSTPHEQACEQLKTWHPDCKVE